MKLGTMLEKILKLNLAFGWNFYLLQLKLYMDMQKRTFPLQKILQQGKNWGGGEEICLSASFLPKQGIEIKWQDQYLHR